jgi:hypothetical protein
VKQRYWSGARALEGWLLLPQAAWLERNFERSGATGMDHGCERVLAEVMGWLARAQDHSRSSDGGVARDFSLIHGWASSYPETTGYIVPTFLEYAKRSGNLEFRERARRMLDWLSGIQLPSGAFMGGKIDAAQVVPVTFNTGQILLGLSAGQLAFGGYGESMCKAADWLASTQDPDGAWRGFPSPFAGPGDKCYDTHVAWGLFEAERVRPGHGYAAAALANVRWVLGLMRSNGWVANCSFDPGVHPLTHTLGYALRGILEAYRFSRDTTLLEAGRRMAGGILGAMGDDGHLPGQLKPDWSPHVRWVCLTGTAQIAHCWLMLYEDTGEQQFADAGFLANAYVRRTVRVAGRPEVRGGVKGSVPLYGAYGRFQYLNWAAKFLADSLMLEMDIRGRARGSARSAGQ